jgi:hypothetical protein
MFTTNKFIEQGISAFSGFTLGLQAKMNH